MSKINTAVISVTIDLDAHDEFGTKIVKVEGMPVGWGWNKGSAMARHGTFVVKPIKAAKPESPAKKEAAPVKVTNEASVQALLSNPGLAEMLAQMMKAQSGTPAETPTIAQARKPGRPRKAA